ncbi:MAG: hypothetical protein J0L73_27005 [Verrucomicrobia bacterium]|nr:hypothetical protein [Verrucomicrobiota bacterium]
MKHSLLKSLAAAAIFAGSASAADVVINITGSTAFRSAANAAIKSALGAGVKFAWTEATAGDGANKATYAIYANTVGADRVIVRAYWAGSIEGVQYPSDRASRNVFIPVPAEPPVGGDIVMTTGSGTNLGNTTYTNPGVIDAGFSDVYKASAGFPNADLQDNVVGVIPFVFVSHSNSPLTNITPKAMQMIYQQDAAIVMNLVDGSTSTDAVYGCGRNGDSGTRVTTLAETGYGYTNVVNQYTASVDASGNVNGAFSYTGNSGFSSGGTLAKTLRGTSSSAFGWGVAYIGFGDKQATNTVLKYNGIDYSTANIQNGSYTLWGYEHCFVAAQVRDATTGTDLVRKTYLANMVANVQADPSASGGIVESTMLVKRSGDGAPVVNK